MRPNRKLKLKLSCSNTKNFPKDFFGDTMRDSRTLCPIGSQKESSHSMEATRRKLKPLKLVAKLMRKRLPTISSNKDSITDSRNQ